MSTTMHPSHKTRRIPDHALFLAGFAAIAAAAAYALYARPDVQRPVMPAERATVGTTPSSTSQHWVLGIREVTPNDSRPVAVVDSAAAPAPAPFVVAEAPQAPTVTSVAAPRHRSHAQQRRYAHASAAPSGAGGARSLASLPPPGD